MWKRWLIAQERVPLHMRLTVVGMLVGIVGFLTCAIAGAGAGIAFFMLIMVGAGAGSMMKWHEERGLWMLAGLFGGVLAAFYAVFFAASTLPSWQGRTPPSTWLVIDQAATLAVLGYGMRLLLSLGWYNWQLDHRAGDGR